MDRGGVQAQLLSLTNSLGLNQSVHFLGYRTDVNDIYSCVDAFAFMSFQEGLPVALMEAMASGVPCICSDIRGNRDLIRNGENGWCIKNDLRELEAALLDCYQHPEKAEKFSEICVGEIDNYSVAKVTKSLVDIYQQRS